MEKRVYFAHTLRSYPPLKEVSAGTEIEEPAYQPAPHGLLTLLAYMTPGPSAEGRYHPQYAGSSRISHKKKTKNNHAPRLAYRRSDGDILSPDGPLPSQFDRTLARTPVLHLAFFS